VIDTAIIKTASSLTFSLYGTSGSLDVVWDRKIDGPICWALKKIGDIWYLVFRGSVTRDDWLHDFEALAIWRDDLLAHVHPGFYAGMKDILIESLAIIGDDDYLIVGHSLGAARAAIAAAYAIVLAPKRPLARITWGEPRPGFSDLAHLLSEIPNYNFLNGGTGDYDRVTDVPFTLDIFCQWYCSGSPHLFVCEPPAQNNLDIIFRWHNFLLYNAAMNKIPDGEM
jgi:hypothetical protein